MARLPPILRHVSPTELQERIAAERSGSPFLVYLDGERRQRLVALTATTLSIGREEESDVPLPWDDEVSRVHAVLDRIGATWTIYDDGLSRNGSYVNGRRLRGRRRLEDGDAITVGDTLLVFVAAPGRAHDRDDPPGRRPSSPPPSAGCSRRSAGRRSTARSLPRDQPRDRRRARAERRDRQEPHARTVRAVRGRRTCRRTVSAPSSSSARSSAARYRLRPERPRRASQRREGGLRVARRRSRRGHRRTPSDENALSRPNSRVSRNVTKTAPAPPAIRRRTPRTSQRA